MKELKGSKRKYNPLNNYLQYLKDNNELTKEEEKLYNSRGREFINMIETTAMTKTYKMPLLLVFYNEGNIKMEITASTVYTPEVMIKFLKFNMFKGRFYKIKPYIPPLIQF